METLIVGASGFIGGRLSDYLVKKNIKVTNASRKNKINFLKINWDSKKSLNNLCKNKDIVINCSGLDFHGSKNKKKTYIANSKNPLKLFKAANLNHVKLFIHISTNAVYKKTNSNIINEKTKIKAYNLHTYSKIHGENNLINYPKKKSQLLIIRSCNLFGYPKYKNKNCWRLLINYLTEKFVAGKPVNIKTSKNVYKTYSSMESFCFFLYKLIKYFNKNKQTITIINYTSNKNYSITEIIDLLKKKIINNKKLNIKIKPINKKLKKTKKIKFQSLYQKRIKPVNDSFFDKEINYLINYCQKFKL
jgi:nucleoside-diphosphate-sugar epimerase